MQDVHLTGRCLCGAVQYEINGTAERFYHCHCQRCRRTTGTGHASNLLVKPESSLTWTKGEELLRRFKVPEAERFYNCFCSQCGSPMPRRVPQLEGVVIPAGTLNEEPPMQPQARIFQDSRASWSCSGDGLPTWPEYQPPA
ncbi:MAG TPA: GFA family protein [Gammaproteobacteria bacterium]|nr:GFA family protein [Gammaproteobacteria bacterium]